MASKPFLAYWDFRGIGQPIRNLLAFQGIDFDEKRYKNEEGKDSQWFKEKFTIGLDFPNLPYFIDGDVKLTQTIAILRYLARKYKLDGENENEKNRIALVEQQVYDLATSFFQAVFGGNFENKKPEILKALPDQLKAVSTFLGSNQFVSGGGISYADFWLYEYLLRIRAFAPDIVNKYSNLEQFISRVESQPNLAAYMKKTGPQPFVGKAAPWNSTY